MTFSVKVDWDDDGTFTAVGDDITADVRPGYGNVTVSYGRDAGGNAPTTAGSGGLVLDNRDSKFSARNTASPLYGKIKPRRPVEITRTVAGTTYNVFRGVTAETPLSPEVDTRTASPALVDRLGLFRGVNISTAVYRGITTGQAIGYVLDAVGWTGGRDIDPGATVMPWWWEGGTDALTALDKLVRSEGFPAYVSMGSSDEVIFRDRFHRATRSASSTTQGTWRASGLAPTLNAGFRCDDGWDNIVNQASVTVEERVQGQLTEVWRTNSPVYVNFGQTKTFWVTFTDPVYDAQVPALEADDYAKTYPALSMSGTITLTRTSGLSLGITITMPGVGVGPFNVSFLRLRARTVTSANTQVVTASDATSQADYGVKNFEGDPPWCGVYDAQAIADGVIAARKEPLATVDARFVVGRDGTKVAALLPRDLSDRVKIIEPVSALNNDFHIERIQHAFTGEHDHEMTFTLEQVPPTTYTDLFILDSSVLDTGRLG